MPVVAVALRHKRSEVGLVDFAGPQFMYPVRFQGKDTNRRQFWQEDAFSHIAPALLADSTTHRADREISLAVMGVTEAHPTMRHLPKGTGLRLKLDRCQCQ